MRRVVPAMLLIEVTGDYRVGVRCVPSAGFPGGANLHEVNTTEIYHMVEGVATLVTGGALTDPQRTPNSTNVRGSGIERGVSRRITTGAW